MNQRRSLIKLSASILLGAMLVTSFPGLLQAAPQANLYWGAYIVGSTYGTDPATGQTYANPPWDMAPWDLFEAHAGKKMSIFHWGSPWYATTQWPHGYFPFPTSLMTTIRSRGAIPMLDWSSFDLSAGRSLNQPAFALSTIISGAHDAYIRQWATDAKAWGFPLFLRFDWEMNGNWFPWSEQVNGNAPGQYVAAWRHVHDIFTAVGATNVTWVWSPNIASSTGSTPMAELYPGDSYVDWTGLDAYNKYGTWATASALLTGAGANWLGNSYQELLAAAPAKPVMLAEVASLEGTDGGTQKAAWITDALTKQIPTSFPAIKAIVWFNWNSDAGSNYVIESSAAAQSAFAAGIASSAYAANDFSALPAGSKIQPLSPVQPTSTATATKVSTATPTKVSTATPVKTQTPAPTVTRAPTATAKATGKPGRH